MKFSEKLYKQMLSLGMNQQKLARQSGVSDSEVSRILAGKSQPGLENAFKLAQAVGVSLDYLADESLLEDPARSDELVPPEEREVMELARQLGPRQARRLLETASELGYELATRRLLGVETKSIPTEPPEASRSILPPPPSSTPSDRAGSA
jgi:transcriptional regulator with XRE-family HTH domain